MTDQTQSAVEVMARAAYDQFRDQFDPEDRPGRWEDLDEEDRASCLENAQCQHDAFLAHLTESGWQIVPVVATEGMCRAWEAATNGSMSFENTNDEEVNNIFARMDYAAMLAAAPPFPGRDG